MTFEPPERFNIADHLLDARIREGRGSRVALVTDQRTWSYRDVQGMANRYGNLLREAGVMPEQRVIIALPDGPEFVAALFGILKIGAVVVMVNPDLKPDAISYFYQYTRARAAFVHRDNRDAFEAARADAPLGELMVVGSETLERRLEAQSLELETFPSHRDDACIWLFSGGTTGHPKAVLQSHWSFAHTTAAYGQGVLGITEDDVTISVPKLFFGYAMGTNLFFPFSVGARSVLYPDKPTPERLFELIRAHRPTVLVNVPTMVNHMVSHPAAGRPISPRCGWPPRPARRSRSSCTSGGRPSASSCSTAWAPPKNGTCSSRHRPGAVRPGTMGDRWCRGSRCGSPTTTGESSPTARSAGSGCGGRRGAIAYWQQMERRCRPSRGEWYVSGDMIRRDKDGYFTYCGRGDDMLKVGRWLAPQEVENCLCSTLAVKEAAVVGVVDAQGSLSRRLRHREPGNRGWTRNSRPSSGSGWSHKAPRRSSSR